MPHKGIPITCERICGMARLARGYARSYLRDQERCGMITVISIAPRRDYFPRCKTFVELRASAPTDAALSINCWYILKQNGLKPLTLLGALLFSQTILTHLGDRGVPYVTETIPLGSKYAMERWLEGIEFATGLKI